jgi:hypothetical protein
LKTVHSAILSLHTTGSGHYEIVLLQLRFISTLQLNGDDPFSSLKYIVMQKLILLLTMLIGFSIQGQCQVSDESTTQKFEKIYTKVEVESEFHGGDAAWRNYLHQNLNNHVPVANGAPAGSYTVIVKFVVHKNGFVNTVTAETNLGYGMEAEAIRLFQHGPKWTPAKVGGVYVSSYRRQPVTFVVP